jgi:hypothetical protein
MILFAYNWSKCVLCRHAAIRSFSNVEQRRHDTHRHQNTAVDRHCNAASDAEYTSSGHPHSTRSELIVCTCVWRARACALSLYDHVSFVQHQPLDFVGFAGAGAVLGALRVGELLAQGVPCVTAASESAHVRSVLAPRVNGVVLKLLLTRSR